MRSFPVAEYPPLTIAQTITVTINDADWHLVAYYSTTDVQNGTLKVGTPTQPGKYDSPSRRDPVRDQILWGHT